MIANIYFCSHVYIQAIPFHYQDSQLLLVNKFIDLKSVCVCSDVSCVFVYDCVDCVYADFGIFQNFIESRLFNL